ncbi:hypothetical protein SEA_CRUNCHYBOI_26 [Microbacterium phage CrunchyBoi]|nr:hypothetical protein SEA_PINEAPPLEPLUTO_26 [Microbacterium phage PineapplePluto]QQO39369.1 hypothetical protein SEA_CRUNCHYBOI_26 [Microbacterium phage CrunchyBoi]
MEDKGFIIDNPGDPEKRAYIALLALRGRFKIAIRVGRSDGYALYNARRWAEKLGIKDGTKTMKQNLRWIEAKIAEIKAQREQAD